MVDCEECPQRHRRERFVSLQANTYRFRYRFITRQRDELATAQSSFSEYATRRHEVAIESRETCLPARHPWTPSHMQRKSVILPKGGYIGTHSDDRLISNLPSASTASAVIPAPPETRITHQTTSISTFSPQASFIPTNRNPVPES